MTDHETTLAHLERLKTRWLGEIMQFVSQTMRDECPPDCSLVSMAEYHFGTGGKRLRALIPLAVADALGVDPARLVPFAAACEMLHNATLVHDDLQDGDTTRRGEPTVWAKWGEPRAINLGDAMLYWTLALAQRGDFDAEAQNRSIARIVRDTLRVIDGQEREFLLKEMATPTSAAYIRMVEGKTSGLFALPMGGAAELCGAPTAVVDALSRAAMELGVLFQVQDDVLDLYADKGREERGSDLGEGKISALVVHFLEHAPPDEARWIAELLRRPRGEVTVGDVERAAQLFRERGSLDWVFAEIERRRRAALDDAVLSAHPSLHRLVAGIAELFLEPIAAVR